MQAKTNPTVAVLGTMTRDTTTYADGRRTENLGGILYTLATLASLFQGRGRILPVANVGTDLFEQACAVLQLPGVDLAGLRCDPGPNNHVFLTYHDNETRDEVLRGLVPPIALEHALVARAADTVLVNMTSGCDLELETLEAFRNRFAGTLQLDVHSLTLAITTGGKRVPRCPEGWESWIRCADWVQMNEAEARLLGDDLAVEDFAARVLDLGPRGVLVTLGSRGCLAAWKEKSGIQTLELDAAEHPDPAYPTGCGDVFGATFAFALLSGAAISNAVQVANGVASTKACHESQAELQHIRQHAAAHLQALG